MNIDALREALEDGMRDLERVRNHLPTMEAKCAVDRMLRALAASKPEPQAQASCCNHASDCAVHNEPAYPAGPCDCGAEQQAQAGETEGLFSQMRLPKGPILHSPSGCIFDSVIAAVDGKDLLRLTPEEHPETCGIRDPWVGVCDCKKAPNLKQAQAGEPDIVAWSTGLAWGHRQSEQVVKLTRTEQREHGYTTGLITLQSHREAMVTERANWAVTKRRLESHASYSEKDAKKLHAALLACVETLEAVSRTVDELDVYTNSKDESIRDVVDAAITKGWEAMK